jgi:putative transposase
MSHAYSGNFVHCVFSTKGRRNTIPADLQSKLRGYMCGIAQNLNTNVIATGGTANHVHLLMTLAPTSRLSEVIQKVKANSSRWMGEQGKSFEWQKGYGAFSVSPSMLEVVKAYVLNQEEHHRKRSFEEEFLALLKKSGVAFDQTRVFADCGAPTSDEVG